MSTAGTPAEKSPWILEAAGALLLLLNMFLAGVLAPAHAESAGEVVGRTTAPAILGLIVVGLFSLSRGMRNRRSRAKVLLVTMCFMLLGNCGRIGSRGARTDASGGERPAASSSGLLRAAYLQADHDTTGYTSTLCSIARSIEALKPDYPQLAEFSAAPACDGKALAVMYGYRTTDPPRTGGWTSGVPHPTDEGVWFHFDFHDPDSKAEIHRQPVVPRYRFKDKEVQLLILEGRRTKSLHGPLVKILLDHGAQPAKYP